MKEVLEKILNDLSAWRGKGRSEVFYEGVAQRVQQNISVYEKELSDAADFLSAKNDLKILRRINKG